MKWGIRLVAALGLCASYVWASGPIAVYALVDKVSMEPNADHPQRIRVSGVFMLSSVPDGCGPPSNPCATSYGAPQRGYLYLALPDQHADQALNEWADMKSVAGTHQVVGFGSGWFANPVRLYKEGEKDNQPSAYPINNNGLVKVNADRPQAKALLEYKDK